MSISLAAPRLLATQALRDAEAAFMNARAQVNRIEVADIILGADLSRAACISVIDWADEPNDDNTFDVDLGEVLDGEGEHLTDLGGENGAIPAGHFVDRTALSDWDIFTNGTVLTHPIQVSLVMDWAVEQDRNHAR